MECSHGQLRAGFTDGLGGNDADRFTDVHQVAMGQIASVAHGAYAVFGPAGQYGADIHPLNARAVDFFRQGFVDGLIGLYDHFVGEGIPDFLQSDAAQHTLAGRFNDFTALHQRGYIESVNRFAILLGDDAILRHIDQSPGQVAGVRRFQGRIRQSLAGAVRGNEVLQNRQPFTEVGRNRRFDDFAGGLRHQAAHAGQLPQLLPGAAGAGIRHHVNRIEAFNSALFAVRARHFFRTDAGQHFGSDLFRRLRPDVNDLVVSFAVGNQTVHVLFLNLQHILVRLRHNVFLVFGNDHVADRKGQAGNRRIFESQILEAVGQEHRGFIAANPVTVIDQVGQLLLVHQLVDRVKTDFLGQNLKKDNASGRRFFELRFNADFDPRMQVNRSRVQRRAHFVRTGEDHAFALHILLGAGQIVNSQNDVLAGNDNRLAVGRGKDVVRGHHQNARFGLRLDGQRDVDGHLIAVKVRVEGRANQRVQADCFSFDQHRLKRLHAQTVQRRRAVQHHRVFPHDFVNGVPDFGGFPLHHFLGAFDRRHIAFFQQAVIDKGFEKLQRHLFGQPALMQP